MIRFALTGVLTICVMAAGPAAASASTISSDGTTITVSAGAGEQNKLQFSSYKGHIEITDSAGATPGAGCSPGITGYSGYSVACPAGPTAARVDLGDGDDLMQIGPDPGLAFTVSGGPGNDDIDTGTRNDVVDGGPGRDHIETYEGDDHVEAADGEHDFISCDAVAHPSGGNDSARVDVGVGADASDEVQDCEQVDRVFAGGGVAAQVTGKPAPNSGDSPRLDYGGAPGAANDVSLTLEDNNWVLREPGGLAATGDCVRRSPTEVACPRHGPTLIAIDLGDGNDRAATDTPFPASPEKLDTPYVFGGAGDDTITGGPGGEALLGDDGNDTLRGGDNADRLEGGNGNDTLDGGAGSDQLLGLAGDDHLIGGTGLDFFDPGEATDRGKNASGTDTFDARDGDADALNCDGHDRATLDRLDDVSGCKHPKVGDTRPRASFTVKPVGLVLKAPARGGKFKLRLRCPRNARPGCAGGVRVGDIRAGFNIKPGRTVAIPIAESRSYGNTRGTRIRMDDPLYVVTHDEAGHTRTLKLRLTLLFT